MTVAHGEVVTERRGEVAVVRLVRPPHNLLTLDLLRQLADTLTSLDEQTKAAVVCAEGRSFCAGADFRSGDAPDPADGDAFAARTAPFYEQAGRLFDVSVPLVAAIQGAAIGAGFGLALACDLRVVGRSGWFQANFVHLGIHPGFALSFTIPRLVGAGAAADLLLTGRRVGAEEAHRIGLAERVVDADVVEAAVEVAAGIAGAAPLAVRSTRATLRQGLAAAARSSMDHELLEQAALARTADAGEGVRAMLDGRAPRFEGR